MSLTITDIPTIMRSKKWLNGAALLDSWFSRYVTVAPKYGLPDTTTVRMDSWVLTFLRAKKIYDELMKERIWTNIPAQGEITKMLRRKGLLKPASRSFGHLGLPIQIQDDDYINFRVVKFDSSDLDDMTATLGNFAFRVLVAGFVTAPSGVSGQKVTITEVGVYIRDSFDFNGDQFLGFWDGSDNSVSMINPFSGTSGTNQDFRDWRSKNNMGGDFIVFSEIKRRVLTSPDTFFIK